MRYEAWCMACERVTTHEAGACLSCRSQVAAILTRTRPQAPALPLRPDQVSLPLVRCSLDDSQFVLETSALNPRVQNLQSACRQRRFRTVSAAGRADMAPGGIKRPALNVGRFRPLQAGALNTPASPGSGSVPTPPSPPVVEGRR